MKPTRTIPSFAFLLTFSVLFVGCHGKQTQIPFLDSVMTTTDFSEQPGVREKVLAFCANDAGRLYADSNCVNAAQSVRMTTSGTGNFPRLDVSPPSAVKGGAVNK